MRTPPAPRSANGFGYATHEWSRDNQNDQAAMAAYPHIDFHDFPGCGASIGLTAQRCGRLPAEIN
ncbi:hypothetical protein D3C84_1227310 [compost metagenome]